MSVIRGSRQLHRWIAYGLGLLVLLWTVTGVVMIFPAALTTRPLANPPLNPADASRTPSEAFHALALGEAQVRGVSLRYVAGTLVYDFVMPDGSHAFVDAKSAQPLAFTDSLARRLLNEVLPSGVAPRQMQRLDAHDATYPFGPLPAYRFELDDPAHTVVHIGADATINSVNRGSRFRGAMGQLHQFQLPGNIVPQRPRKLLLLGASALTIVLIATGYILVIPLWRRKRPTELVAD